MALHLVFGSETVALLGKLPSRCGRVGDASFHLKLAEVIRDRKPFFVVVAVRGKCGRDLLLTHAGDACRLESAGLE